MAQKKEVKVRDLKPAKDAKGGVARAANRAAGNQNRAGNPNRVVNQSRGARGIA